MLLLMEPILISYSEMVQYFYDCEVAYYCKTLIATLFNRGLLIISETLFVSVCLCYSH